jgi:hypothetical protein
MAKHFHYRIRSNRFTCERNQASIEREAALDEIYLIRTTVPTASASSEQAVRHHRELAKVERAFRSLKSVDLRIRSIHHHLEERVCAHVFLRMPAYYVEWNMRQALAPMLFDDYECSPTVWDQAAATLRRSNDSRTNAYPGRVPPGNRIPQSPWGGDGIWDG